MKIEQHHQFRDGKRFSWHVPRLIKLAETLDVFAVPIDTIKEIDSVYWFDDTHKPTCRAVVEHAKRLAAADLSRPILLSQQGYVMDGMHRICRALLEGHQSIPARRFDCDPEPDTVEVLGIEGLR